MHPAITSPYREPPSTLAPGATGARPIVAVMGACTIPGLLTLVAILGDGNIHLDKAIWLLLALGGGGVGWCLGNLFSRGRFGFR